MSRLRALILDFDGVIADTERLHLQAFQQALAKEGIELSAADYAARYLGHPDSEVFAGIARDRALHFDSGHLESLLEHKAALYDALVASGDVMAPGAADKVREWSRVVPLAVASGARRSEIEHVLRTAGLLPYFVAVVAAEDVTCAKPAPDPYLLALRLITLSPGLKPRPTTSDEGRPTASSEGRPTTPSEGRPTTSSEGRPTASSERPLAASFGGPPGPSFQGRPTASSDGDVAARGPSSEPEAVRRQLGIGSDSVRGTADIAPDRVVAVEDSPPGLAAIKAAGMHAVAVTTNYPADVLAPLAELVVGSVAELDLDTLEHLIN